MITPQFDLEGKPVRASIAYLAGVFADTLHDSLTPPQWEAVRRLNAIEEKPGVCHSHDFLDANDVMADAFRAAFGRDCNMPYDVEADGCTEAEQERDFALWNAAWDMAHSGWLTADRGPNGEYIEEGAQPSPLKNPVTLLRALREEVRDWQAALDGERPTLDVLCSAVDTYFAR